MWRVAPFLTRRVVGARRRAGLIGAWALVALALVYPEPVPARAHSVTIGQSKIHQEGRVVRYELAVNYDQLVKRIGLAPDTRACG